MNRQIKLKSKLTAFALAFSAMGIGQAQTVDEVTSKYQKQFDELNAKAQQVSREAEKKKPSALGAALTVPCDVKMSLQKIIINVPEVTFKQQDIIFHLPAIRMKETRIGPIVMHVPQFLMEEQRISLHLPEFTNRTQEIKLDIPELTCGRADLSIGMTKKATEEIVDQAKTLTGKMKKDLVKPVGQKKEESLKGLGEAINSAEAVVAKVRAAGGDIAALLAQVKEMKNRKAEMARKFEEAIETLKR